MLSILDQKLYKALSARRKAGVVPVQTLLQETGSAAAPDLFSNDYMSLTTNPTVRQTFIDALASSDVVMGAGGSRLLSGNSQAHIDFEQRLKVSFGAEAALLFNTGYDANVAFFNSVPQAGDAIIFDQLAHASIRDGISLSRAAGAVYDFKHNSVRALRECISRVLAKHPAIAEGKATLFIAVESLYSMDGDFVPLPEIVHATKELVPPGCYHIYVDEAHTTGICGPQARGLVAALGLDKEVQSVLHTFSKARAFLGGVILTSPIVREYIVNYARAFIYSTSLPHAALIGLRTSFDYIESDAGAKDMKRLRFNADYLLKRLAVALATLPRNVLSLTPPCLKDDDEPHAALPEDVISPIIPIYTGYPLELQAYLQGALEYRVWAIAFPVVPRGQGRIRAIVHAGNTLEELDVFVLQLVAWTESMVDGVQSGNGVVPAKL